MPDPTVSILMAVYNGQDIVSKTIESMLAQTWGDFEFVIVDDGSTDSTVAVVRSFDDPRIVLHVNETNRGQTQSLDAGLRLCRGRYVARIDAGDFSLPARLGAQVRFMDRHPRVAAAGTAAVMVDPDGRKLGIARRPGCMQEVLLQMFYVSPLIHVSAMMRREDALTAGGYDPDFYIAADHELWSRMIRAGRPVTSLRRALVGYEIDPSSLSREHLEGKVTREASEIIRRNAESLAGVVLSLDEARDIFRMFTFPIERLAPEGVQRGETLYRKIIAAIDTPLCGAIPPAALEKHLVRNHLKSAVRQLAAGNASDARKTLRTARAHHGRHAAITVLWPITYLGRLAARLLPAAAKPSRTNP